MTIPHIYILPQTLGEPEPNRKKADGRREDLFVPEGVRRFLELVEVLPVGFRP